MTAPLVSVVVPTRNSAGTLERCLRSARAQRHANGDCFPVEVIVVDNHSTDATALVAAGLADRVEVCGPERSAQRNRGTALAGAPVVLFVDSDMVLEPTVCAEVADRLADASVGAVIIPELSFGAGFWARCRAFERRVTMGDGNTEAARGYRVGDLAAAGGWDESLNAFEDWDLHDRVTARCGPPARTDAFVHHDEGRLSLRTSYAKKRYYGAFLPGYLRSRPAAAAGRLSPRRLLRRPGMLLASPHLAGGMVVLKLVEVTGFLVGSRGAARRRQ